MQYVCLTVSGIFLIALFYSSQEGNIDNVIFQLIITVVLFVFFIIFRLDSKRNQKLMFWIMENKNEIVNKGLTYNGALIDGETSFYRYEVCLSLGFLSFRRTTGYYIRDYHFTPLFNLLFSSFSFVFGWWALPMGPINTIRAIFHNMNSKSWNVDALINQLNVENEKGV